MSDSLPEAQILDLSNRFYTLIPHDFGMKKPPLLNNLDYIQVGKEIMQLFIIIKLGIKKKNASCCINICHCLG